MSNKQNINSPIREAYNTVLLSPRSDHKRRSYQSSSTPRYASLLNTHLNDYSTQLNNNKELNEKLNDVEAERYDLHWRVKELQTELELTQKKYRLSHLTAEDLQKRFDEQYKISKLQEATVKKVRKTLRLSQEKVTDLTDEILRLREENKQLKLQLNSTSIKEEAESNINQRKSKIIHELREQLNDKQITIDEYKEEIKSQNCQLQQLRKDLQNLNKKHQYLQTMPNRINENNTSQSSSYTMQNQNNHKFYYFLLKWDTMLSNMGLYNESIQKMIKMKTITLASIPKDSSKHITLSSDIVELNQVLDDATKFVDHLRKEKKDMIKNHFKTIEKYIVTNRKQKLLNAWRHRYENRNRQRDMIEKICKTQCKRQCQYAFNKLSNDTLTKNTLKSKENIYAKAKQWYFLLIAFLFYKFTHSRLQNKRYQKEIIPKLTHFVTNKKLKYQIFIKLKTAAFQTKLFNNIINHRIGLNSKSNKCSKQISLNNWRHYNEIAKIHEQYEVRQHFQNKQLRRKSITFAAKMTRSMINKRNDPKSILYYHFNSWSTKTKENRTRMAILYHIIHKNEIKLMSKSFNKLQKVAAIKKLHLTNNQYHKIRQTRLKQKFLVGLMKMNEKNAQKGILKTWLNLSNERRSQKNQLLKCLNRIQSTILQHAFTRFRVQLQARSTVYFAQRLTNESITSNALRQKFIKSNQVRNIFSSWFQTANLRHKSDIALVKMSQIYRNVKLREAMKNWRGYDINMKMMALKTELTTEAQSTVMETIYQERFDTLKSKAIAMMIKKTTMDNTLYWFVKWKMFTRNKLKGYRLLKKIMIRQRMKTMDIALKMWKLNVLHKRHLSVLKIEKSKANTKQKSMLRLLASQSKQRTRQIALRFWRNRTRAKVSCKFIIGKYVENRERNNIQFAWNNLIAYTQMERMEQLKELHAKQEEKLRQQTLQSTLFIMSRRQKAVSIKMMFLNWKNMAIHKQLQAKLISNILLSNKQRLLRFGIREWEKNVYSQKMVKQKSHIRKLREYAKQQDEKKKTFERRMKRKTIFLYLDMRSKNKCGKFLFKWMKYTQNEKKKREIIQQYTVKIEKSILHQFIKQWRHNCDKLVHDEKIYKLKQSFGAYTTANVTKQKLMKTFFAWKRYTIHNMLAKDSLTRSLPICKKQLQRQAMKKWQAWLKFMDINDQLEYQRRETEKFEKEINKLKVSFVGLEEENKNLKIQQRYVKKWKLKVLHIKNQRIWLQKCIDSEFKERIKKSLFIWKRHIDAINDAEEKLNHDRKIKAVQLTFSHKFFKQTQKMRMQEIFIQWKVALDEITKRKQNVIYSIVQKQYRDNLHFAINQWRKECVIQRKLKKIQKYFVSSFISASFKQWNEMVHQQKEKRQSLMKCVTINADLNKKYVISRWYKILNASVKKHYRRTMEKQKLDYYKKLKIVCKLQTLETIKTNANVLMTVNFKQWKVISKSLQRRKNILFKCIDYQKQKVMKQALMKWSAREERKMYIMKYLFIWRMKSSFNKSTNVRILALKKRMMRYKKKQAFEIWMNEYHKNVILKQAFLIPTIVQQRNVLNEWRNSLYHFRIKNEAMTVKTMEMNHLNDLEFFSLIKCIDISQRVLLKSAINRWNDKGHKKYILNKLCRYYESKACKSAMTKWRISSIARLGKIAQYQTHHLYQKYYAKKMGKIFKFWQNRQNRNTKFRSLMALYCIKKDINSKNVAFTKWKQELLGFKVNDRIVTITQHYDNIIQQINDRNERLFIISQTCTENRINHLKSKVYLQKWRISKLYLDLDEKTKMIKEIHLKYQSWQLKKVLNIKQDRVLLRAIYQWKCHQTMDQAQKAYIKLFLSSQHQKRQFDALYHFKLNVFQHQWEETIAVKDQQMQLLNEQIEELSNKNEHFHLALTDIETMQTELTTRDAELQSVTEKVRNYKLKAKETYYSTLIQHIEIKRKNKLWKIWKSQFNQIQQRKQKLFLISQTQYIKLASFVIYRFKQYSLSSKLQTTLSDKALFIQREQELQQSIKALNAQIYRLSETISALTDENAKLMQYRLLKTKTRQKSLLQQQSQLIKAISPQNIITNFNTTSQSNTDEITSALLNHNKENKQNQPKSPQRIPNPFEFPQDENEIENDDETQETDSKSDEMDDNDDVSMTVDTTIEAVEWPSIQEIFK